MKWKGRLAGLPLISKLLVFAGISLLSTSLFTFLGFIASAFVFHLDLLTDQTILTQLDHPGVIDALKLIQTLSAIGLFIIPSLIAGYLFSFSPADYIYIRRMPSFQTAMLVTVILFASIPLINWMVTINQQMALPSLLKGIEQWMKDSEAQAAELTEAFLKTTSTTGLLANIFIIGFLPAIGEELFFRGVLLRMLSDSMKNKHLPIIISAVLFSAIHMQFYGFLPRMMLGVLFGYFVLWSRSLWLPVIAHFINNATAVIFAYYAAKEKLPFDQDTIGTQPGEQIYLACSIIITAAGLFFLYKSYSSQKQINIS